MKEMYSVVWYSENIEKLTVMKESSNLVMKESGIVIIIMMTIDGIVLLLLLIWYWSVY